eukprot:6821983-Prymnesium_polylepis.1
MAGWFHIQFLSCGEWCWEPARGPHRAAAGRPHPQRRGAALHLSPTARPGRRTARRLWVEVDERFFLCQTPTSTTPAVPLPWASLVC